MDGVESILMDSSLVQVSTVTDLLLLLSDLCAVGHDCTEGEKVLRVKKKNHVKVNLIFIREF